MAATRTAQTPALEAWVRLLRGHAAIVRALNAQLLTEHGLTINDYEALLLLANAEGQRLRRTDLAQRIQLTPSGVTRLLDGLEAAGLVARAVCDSDARVAYAVLTEAGSEKLEDASCSHVKAISDLFASQYSAEEMTVLAELLSRLPGACGGPSCVVPTDGSAAEKR